jgi:hypothetical protein
MLLNAGIIAFIVAGRGSDAEAQVRLRMPIVGTLAAE